jgi:hypothetical protein
MRRNSFAVVVFATFGAACSAIIGIEDVHEGPDPAAAGADGGSVSGSSGSSSGGKGGGGVSGKGGAAGSAGTAGTTGGSGGKGGSSAGSSGSSGSAGSAGAASGSGGTLTGAGGSGAEGGEDTGGSGGSTPVDTTVRGRVVSYYLQPIDNVQVMIGDAAVETDEDGEFEIPDVPEEYDLKLVVTYLRNTFPASYGWVYEGLTRRDPTLQVYGGLDDRSGDIIVTPQNAVVGSTRELRVALGSLYGSTQHGISSAAGLETSTWWNGPESAPGTAHGLIWEMNEDELPTSYAAYNSTAITLSSLTDTNIVFDMADNVVDFGTISGTVTSPTSVNRENRVFVRFTSNADIELVDHYGTSLDVNSFAYVVPSLTNGTITVSAAEGDYDIGAVALVHRGGLSPGETDIELVIPEPSVLTAPPNDDTGITHESIFSWTGDAETYVWHAEDQDLNTWGGLYVVTTRKQFTIPTFPNGFRLAAGHVHSWEVETHGTASSVDELTGPDGFADAFGESKGSAPAGPPRGNGGQFTISSPRFFTPAE